MLRLGGQTRALLASKKFADAVSELQAATTSSSDAALAFFYLGFALREQGEGLAANEAFCEAAKRGRKEASKLCK